MPFLFFGKKYWLPWVKTLFFVLFAKRRCGLQKKSSKILKNIGRKNILKISSKIFFCEISKSWSNFVWKKIRRKFCHTKLLQDFEKFRKYFWRNFQNIFSTNFFQYFSMIFFVNHIYSSRRIRKTRFQTLLSNLSWFLERVMLLK